MIDYIKSKLLENPEKIKEFLEHFGYCNIRIRPTYLSFGREETSSPKSLVCRIDDNPNLICKDYARNITLDIFNLVIKQRSVSFKEAISVAKDILGIEGYCYQEKRSRAVFGGFYDRIKSRKDVQLQVYDDSILDKYVPCGNKRFLKDGISLKAQRYFQIGYSVEDQAITIPIWNEIGQLVGVKMRCNHEVQDGEQKYWYKVPTMMSQLLYGYSQNYEYLESADIIYIFESEKSVMQCFTYGIRNVVALGSGSISKKQAQLLLSLNVSKIVLMHDTAYKKEFIELNIQIIKGYSKMRDIQIGYWDNENKGYEDKVSASDLGEDKLKYILKNEIKYVEE